MTEKNGPSKCIPNLLSSSTNLRIDGLTIIERVFEGALGLILFPTKLSLCSFSNCLMVVIVSTD